MAHSGCAWVSSLARTPIARRAQGSPGSTKVIAQNFERNDRSFSVDYPNRLGPGGYEVRVSVSRPGTYLAGSARAPVNC